MLRRVSIFALGFVLLGCLPYSPVEHAKPPLEVPEKYAHSEVAKNAGQRWWESLGDAQLNTLVETALTGNFDVMIAWARLEQAQAVATAAGAPLWPSLSAYATVSKSVPIPGFDVEQIRLGAQAAYELDLFGRNLTEAEAAGLESINARDNVEVAAITVSAETAQAYFNRIYSAHRVKIFEEQLETNNEYLDLIELRFEKGLSSALDVYQQTDRSIATEQALLSAKLDERTAIYTLAQLLGRAPSQNFQMQIPEELPIPPKLPEDGISSSLLVQRPDVRAARRSVTIADKRVGIAIAEYLPRLFLDGGLFFLNNGFDEFTLFDNLLYSFTAQLTQNIFDGFAREARIDQNEALVRENLMVFGQRMLRAIVEVETALATEKNQTELLDVVGRRLEQNTKTLREARARYERGLSDFLPVLTAQNAAQAAEVALLDAKRALLFARIQLHRALGGTWTRKLVQPTWVEPEDGEAPAVPPVEDSASDE